MLTERILARQGACAKCMDKLSYTLWVLIGDLSWT
jgi:hypothetical protein